MISVSNNKLTPKEKYLKFVNNNDGHYLKNNKDINEENIVDYLNSLSDDEMNKLSTYDLNIYYYFLNKMFKQYISRQDRIIQIINTCISLLNRHKAFEEMTI